MVERRDAGRRDSQQYSSVRDRWLWNVYELQRFITTKLLRSHCTHICSPFAHVTLGLRCSCLLRERVAEHRISALGLLLGSLVLNDIPVFDENPILQANDVRGDPVYRQSDVGEPAMNDDVVVFCKNHPRLI